MWRSAMRGVMVSSALTMIAASCAKGEDVTDVGDVTVPDPDAGSDVKSPIVFDGSAKDTGSGSSSGDPDTGSSSGCSGKVVINELQNDGPGGAEFIELYNNGTCAVPLGGWKIAYASATGGSGVAPVTFASGDSIASKSFLLYGNASFTGTKQGNLVSGLGNNGGQLGLLDDKGAVVDAVGYKPGTSGKYTEKSPAPDPGSGSVGRKADGVDTDDNAADFKAFTTPTPGAAN